MVFRECAGDSKMNTSLTLKQIRQFRIHFLLSFSRSGSTLVMTYFRAHPHVETGYQEWNALYRLMNATYWDDSCTDIFKITKTTLHQITNEAGEIFTKYFFQELSRMTKKKVAVVKHPWLAPKILRIASTFPGSRIIVLLRHPYDIIGSTMHFRKLSETANAMFPKTLNGLIDMFIDHKNALLNAEKIMSKERLLYMKFEDFLKHPGAWLGQAFKFYGVPSNPRLVRHILRRGQHNKLPLTGHVIHHSTFHVPKDKFAEYLNKPQREVVRKRLAYMVEQLGYEDK